MCELLEVRNKYAAFVYGQHDSVREAANRLLDELTGANGSLQKLEQVMSSKVRTTKE